jgi:ATP-dependent Lon protease
VLPIGGLKEKLLAAQRGGVATVLIPEENRKDLVEIPENIKGKLEIKPVRWIDEVLQIALTRQPVPLPETPSEEPAAAKPARRAKARQSKQVQAH